MYNHVIKIRVMKIFACLLKHFAAVILFELFFINFL